MTDRTATVELTTHRGTFQIPETPEGHTLHNLGPGGIALIHNARTGKDVHRKIPGGTPSEPARYELRSSDEVFLGWIRRFRT